MPIYNIRFNPPKSHWKKIIIKDVNKYLEEIWKKQIRWFFLISLFLEKKNVQIFCAVRWKSIYRINSDIYLSVYTIENNIVNTWKDSEGELVLRIRFRIRFFFTNSDIDFLLEFFT